MPHQQYQNTVSKEIHQLLLGFKPFHHTACSRHCPLHDLRDLLCDHRRRNTTHQVCILEEEEAETIEDASDTEEEVAYDDHEVEVVADVFQPPQRFGRVAGTRQPPPILYSLTLQGMPIPNTMSGRRTPCAGDAMPGHRTILL